MDGRRDLIDNSLAATVNNPVMIAGQNGRLHFLWEMDYARAFHQTSDDDGLTWSLAIEITAAMNAWRGQYDWTVIGLGPGHGIRLTDGRLLAPVWLSNGGGRAHQPSVVSTLYSDDQGHTWSCGEIIRAGAQLINPNESAVAQRSDGRILINMRHETARRRRAVSLSDRGTSNWAEPWLDEALPDPICCAGLVSLPGQAILAFSNCAVEGPPAGQPRSQSRRNLTVRLSLDDGCTWSRGRLLEARSGYSDLAASPDGRWLYCFYEQDWIEESCGKPAVLTVARLNLAWLKEQE